MQELAIQTNFTKLDWAIVAAYLCCSTLIGIYVRKYVSDISDYIAARRALGTCLGIATMTGTELGLITVMYSSQKGFVGGFAAFHIALAAAIVTFMVGVTGFLIYKLRKMEVITIPEFYRKRFGKKTQVLGAVMLALGGILNMGLFLKVGSMFIVGITGMSQTSWALPLVMTVLLVLVIVYTVLGGMIAVVIMDYIQFVILSLGLITGTLMIIYHLGWNTMFAVIQQHMGEKGFNPMIAEGEFGWEYVLWMFFLGLISCAIWPTAVARALAAKSPQVVKRQYMWSSISFMIRFLIPYFWGIAAFVFIMTKSPDLKDLFFPENPNTPPLDNLYAMPISLGKLLPVGLIGIITAAMIAAFMSTHDSYLLCWSSVITQDILAPIMKDKLSSPMRIKLTRILIVLIGAYVLYWGLIYKGSDDVWDYMAVTGAIYFTGAFAVMAGGLYWSRASSTGAVLALLSGATAILGLSPVQDALGFYIPSARMGLIAVVSSLAAMIFGSLLFPDKKEV